MAFVCVTRKYSWNVNYPESTFFEKYSAHQFFLFAQFQDEDAYVMKMTSNENTMYLFLHLNGI